MTRAGMGAVRDVGRPAGLKEAGRTLSGPETPSGPPHSPRNTWPSQKIQRSAAEPATYTISLRPSCSTRYAPGASRVTVTEGSLTRAIPEGWPTDHGCLWASGFRLQAPGSRHRRFAQAPRGEKQGGHSFLH